MPCRKGLADDTFVMLPGLCIAVCDKPVNSTNVNATWPSDQCAGQPVGTICTATGCEGTLVPPAGGNPPIAVCSPDGNWTVVCGACEEGGGPVFEGGLGAGCDTVCLKDTPGCDKMQHTTLVAMQLMRHLPCTTVTAHRWLLGAKATQRTSYVRNVSLKLLLVRWLRHAVTINLHCLESARDCRVPEPA